MDDLLGYASQNELAKSGSTVCGHGNEVKATVPGMIDNLLGIVAVTHHGIHFYSHAF